MNILLTLLSQAHVIELAASHTGDAHAQDRADEMVEKLIFDLFGRALKVSPLHHTNLHDTMLEKPGNLAIPHRTSLSALLSHPSHLLSPNPSSFYPPPHFRPTPSSASPRIVWAGCQPQIKGGATPRHHVQVQATTTVALNKRPVLVCPAQFGVAKDYTSLKATLEAKGHPVYIAELKRWEWLRIVPSAFTKAYWTGNLRPNTTLGFFYEAIDDALKRIARDYGQDTEISIVGHSIGGWVARAYIAERMGDRAVKVVQSLVTLGTPNRAPPKDSFAASIDQTRGLLTFINAEYPSGFPLPPERVTCVIGNGTATLSSIGDVLTKSSFWNSEVNRSALLEQFVALGTYFSLRGKAFNEKGDGLIPVETATMDGCQVCEIDDCNHAGFVPTPGDSILLPESYQWYGTPKCVQDWERFL